MTTTITVVTSIPSSTVPTVVATSPVTNPVTNPVTSSHNIVIGCSIGGVIILLLVVVSVTGLIVFRKKCVRYEDGRHSFRVRSEQALVRKPRANQHNYVDPVVQSLRTQSPFIHNNEESEYFQHPSTFLQGTRRNSIPPPPPDINQINGTEFNHPYSVSEDIQTDESDSSNEYVVPPPPSELSISTQDTSRIIVITDTSYSQTPLTCSSVISIDTHTMDQIMEDIEKYFGNVPVTPLPKSTVGVPEGPKLQEGHYAELQLEGYQRPFQRIPEDPVVYASVTKKTTNTPPPISPKQQQQQAINTLSVQETCKGNDKVNQSTTDNDDYTTEPGIVSDTKNDGKFAISMVDINPPTESNKDGVRTNTATSLVSTYSTIPHPNMALDLGSSSFATFANYHLDCTAYTQNLSCSFEPIITGQHVFVSVKDELVIPKSSNIDFNRKRYEIVVAIPNTAIFSITNEMTKNNSVIGSSNNVIEVNCIAKYFATDIPYITDSGGRPEFVNGVTPFGLRGINNFIATNPREGTYELASDYYSSQWVSKYLPAMRLKIFKYRCEQNSDHNSEILLFLFVQRNNKTILVFVCVNQTAVYWLPGTVWDNFISYHY